MTLCLRIDFANGLLDPATSASIICSGVAVVIVFSTIGVSVGIGSCGGCITVCNGSCSVQTAGVDGVVAATGSCFAAGFGGAVIALGVSPNHFRDVAFRINNG